MSNSGWFLVHRRLFEHEIGQNPLIVALWVRLIADAAYEDKEIWLDGLVLPIKRGQVLTSIKKLSHWLGLAQGTTKRHLNALQKIGQIEIKTTNRYSIITIQNYSRYQTNRDQTENRLRTNRDQTETSKEYKEDKEIKEGEIMLTKNQLEKLQREFPYLKVNLKYHKFREWQRSSGRTFRNVLARFRMWLIEDVDKQNKTTNAILADPIFKKYHEVYLGSDDGSVRAKMDLLPRLTDKFPTWRYEREWIEARKKLQELIEGTGEKDERYVAMVQNLADRYAVN